MRPALRRKPASQMSQARETRQVLVRRGTPTPPYYKHSAPESFILVHSGGRSVMGAVGKRQRDICTSNHSDEGDWDACMRFGYH